MKTKTQSRRLSQNLRVRIAAVILAILPPGLPYPAGATHYDAEIDPEANAPSIISPGDAQAVSVKNGRTPETSAHVKPFWKLIKPKLRDARLPKVQIYGPGEYEPGIYAQEEKTLREFVSDPFKEAVDDFNECRYQEAIRKVWKADLDSHRNPIYQPVYIRGLCYQRLGNFEEAATEFSTVIKFSNDAVLKEKSKLGLECCSRKQSSVPHDMLNFRVRWNAPLGRDILTPISPRHP